MTTKPQSTTETLEPCPFCGKIPTLTIIEEHLAPAQNGYPVHIECGIDCLLHQDHYFSDEIAARKHWNTRTPASTAPVVDDKLVSDLVQAVNRSKSISADGEWWLDTLKAKGRVNAVLARAREDESCKWRVALRMYQKTHDDLVALRQRVEDTIIVAKTDVDEEGGITAYHFKTGAIHRLLAEARQGDGPDSTESNRVRDAAAQKVHKWLVSLAGNDEGAR